MLLAKLFRRSNAHEDAAVRLYATLVEKARDPAFYSRLAVPDTVNGRYDMVVVHAMLVLRRLRGEGQDAEKTGRALLELLFQDMDQSLREMGVGDMGIARHIKKMGKAMFGRAEAYEAGLDGDESTLAAALKDNVYRQSQPTADQLAIMALYMRRASEHLSTQGAPDIVAGSVNLQIPVME